MARYVWTEEMECGGGEGGGVRRGAIYASFHLPFALLLRFIPFFILPPLHSFVRLTGGDDALQPDDVGVVKLSQDAGLAEEGAPLFVRAAGAERLYGHGQLPLAGQLEAAAANLAKVTWRCR